MDPRRVTERRSLIERLEQLNLEHRAVQIIQELRAIEDREDAASAIPVLVTEVVAVGNPFLVGDRVVITNNYKDVRSGTRGTVTSVTEQQVVIKGDGERVYRRKFTNVRHE